MGSGPPGDETPNGQATSRAHDAAASAAIETLLNCYMREGGEWRSVPAADVPELADPGDTHLAVLPMAQLHATLLVGVRHLSPARRHRFRMPVTMIVAGEKPFAVSLDAVAGLLVAALAARAGVAAATPPDTAAALERVRSSAQNVAAFLAARDADIDALYGPAPLSFIASEQALLLGHLVHPTPKSRTEMSPADVAAYSPELGARFALRWLAVDAGLVEHDSATGTPAPELAARLLYDDPEVDGRALGAALAGLGERVLIPAHPWELAHLREHDPAVAALLQDGAIVDLGALGSPVTATTSVRTVYRADWPWQLKFSLHVRVTNALRVTLPADLLRAVEAQRLLQTPFGARAAAAAPGFVLLQDPAYLAVRHGGELVDGLSVLLRDNRWRAGARTDATSLTALCQDHPYGGRSRLGAIVGALARRGAHAENEVAREWYRRYCAMVIEPLVRLYLELGLCMEPHQQNVVLELEDGWPARAVYRDSQGYFHRAAAHDDVTAMIPGIGEASESIFPETLDDERLVYYPFLNNALGVINALGVAGCVDEQILLDDLRALLEHERARARGARYPATLLDRLLDDATWPCKANLLTRMNDRDGLAGDLASPSVYVAIPNPLRFA
jgi:siderophore synthetase component